MTSTNNLKDGIYPVIIKNTITYLNSAGQNQNWAPTQSFSVTVTDSCRTTTITDFTLNDMEIQCGETLTQDFSWPTDSAAVAVSNPNICGTRTYTITETINGVDTAQTFITINELIADGTTIERLTATT